MLHLIIDKRPRRYEPREQRMERVHNALRARVCSENAGRLTKPHLHKRITQKPVGPKPPYIARLTSTIKLDRSWNSFQLVNSVLPLSVTDSTIAPSANLSANITSEHVVSLRCCARVFCLAPSTNHMRESNGKQQSLSWGRKALKHYGSHIDASHSRQLLIKG
jgi:hypothetical protein